MVSCKSILVRTAIFLLFLLATFPAYGQRATVGINVGASSDQFGTLPQVTAADLGLDGQFILFPANKDGSPNIVVGGELRAPADTSDHATEFAIFAGPHFPVRNFTFGFNVQIRKILMPHAEVSGTVLDRFNMELLEIPVVLKYKFGPAKRAYIEAQGQPEFTPRFKAHGPSLSGVPYPNFDYGYTVRGTVGYVVGKWYVKGSYENRIFKFVDNANNRYDIYNWRSNNLTGGIGLIF